MIIDQIDASMKRLELGVSIENAQTFKKDLDSLYSKLCGYENLIVQYMKNALETQMALGQSSDEKTKIIVTLKRFCNDAKDGKRDLALQDLQNLENEISAGNKNLRSIWSNYRSEKFVASKNFISALASIIDEGDDLDKLEKLRIKIESNSIGNRQTVKNIKEYRELTKKIIESKKMEPEVQEFIIELASGEKILLSKITEEIYNWMKDNKLDKKIYLSFDK